MNLLANYGSDDEDNAQQPASANTANSAAVASEVKKSNDAASNATKKRKEPSKAAEQPKAKKLKLPSAAALLSNIPDELMHGAQEQAPDIDSFGTKYNTVAPPDAVLKQAEDLAEDWSVKPMTTLEKKKAWGSHVPGRGGKSGKRERSNYSSDSSQSHSHSQSSNAEGSAAKGSAGATPQSKPRSLSGAKPSPGALAFAPRQLSGKPNVSTEDVTGWNLAKKKAAAEAKS